MTFTTYLTRGYHCRDPPEIWSQPPPQVPPELHAYSLASGSQTGGSTLLTIALCVRTWKASFRGGRLLPDIQFCPLPDYRGSRDFCSHGPTPTGWLAMASGMTHFKPAAPGGGLSIFFPASLQSQGPHSRVPSPRAPSPSPLAPEPQMVVGPPSSY